MEVLLAVQMIQMFPKFYDWIVVNCQLLVPRFHLNLTFLLFVHFLLFHKFQFDYDKNLNHFDWNILKDLDIAMEIQVQLRFLLYMQKIDLLILQSPDEEMIKFNYLLIIILIFKLLKWMIVKQFTLNKYSYFYLRHKIWA